MVYRRSKVSRSTFKKLPTGAAYWLSSNVAVAPLIKAGRTSSAGAFVTNHITQTNVPDSSVAVVKVPKFLL